MSRNPLIVSNQLLTMMPIPTMRQIRLSEMQAMRYSPAIRHKELKSLSASVIRWLAVLIFCGRALCGDNPCYQQLSEFIVSLAS